MFVNSDMFTFLCNFNKINFDEFDNQDEIKENKDDLEQLNDNILNVNIKSIVESILPKVNNEIDSIKNKKIKDSLKLAQKLKNSSSKSFMESSIVNTSVSKSGLVPKLKLFNVKKEALSIKDPVTKKLKANVPNLSNGSYTSDDDYPNTISNIDDAGNFIKVNKKSGKIDIYHQSGNIIKIDKNGNTSIHINGGLKFKIDGDMSFHSNGNVDFVADGELNFQATNITTQTQKNTLNCDENITNNKHNLINTKKSEIKCLAHSVEGSSSAFTLSSSATIKSNLKIKGNIKSDGEIKSSGKITAPKFNGDCDC